MPKTRDRRIYSRWRAKFPEPWANSAVIRDDGTGIALSVCDTEGDGKVKQVIRGDGSSPVTRPRPERAGSEAKGEGERHRVVIADDHADTRVILRHYLEAFGLGVIEASDGPQALSEVKRVAADVVILDMQMPRLDGLGVLRKIRSDAATANLPVIVLTGDVDLLDRARAAGANECLTKPAHPRALYEAVRTLLAQRDA